MAAAYGTYALLVDTRLPALPALRIPYVALLAVVLALGLLYPIMGVYTRMFVENGRLFALNPPPLTLNGGTSFTASDDYESIMCLNTLVEGDDVVVAEAIGGHIIPPLAASPP